MWIAHRVVSGHWWKYIHGRDGSTLDEGVNDAGIPSQCR